MELELGFKITKTRDDFSSISEYRLAKDRTGPIFQSRETSTMFILIVHLKGYKKNNIGIKISEDGSKISISGEKPIQEMLMVGWVMLKKQVEITGFSKVFRIPDGVILDRIKAKYDEDESILKIVMAKSVKGICGARIEEVKEEEYDRGKSKGDQILKSVGETSQKRSEDSDVRGIEDSESIIGKKEGLLYENMLHDANGNIIGETNKREIESKLGIEDRNRDKVGEKEYVAMKTLELEKNLGASNPENIEDASQDKEFKVQEMEHSENVVEKKERVGNEKMLDDANGEIFGQIFRKEIEEYMLDSKDRNGESVTQKVGKEGYDVMKKSELEKNVGSSQNKESGVIKMKENESIMENKKGGMSNKIVDIDKKEIIGDKVQKEIEEYRFEFEYGNEERVKEKVSKAAYETVKKPEMKQNEGIGIPQNNGDTSQDRESEVIEMEDDGSVVGKKRKMVMDKRLDDAEGNIGEMVQKGIEDGDGESVREKDGKVGSTAMKTSQQVHNLADHNPRNFGGISQEDFEESKIQQMEKTENVEGKIDGWEAKSMPVKAIPKNVFEENDIVKSKSETENVDQESVREKAGKEELETMITEKEEVLENLPKATLEGSKGLNVSKIQETEYVDGATVIRKGNEIENFVEKEEGEEPIRMHVEAKRLAEKDETKNTRQERIERPKSETKDSDQQNVQKNTVKGGFEVPNRIIEEFTKQEGEKLSGGGKRFEVAKSEESEEVIKEAMPEIESLLEKVEAEESRKRTEEASRTTDKRTLTETLQKEIEEYIIERKSKDGANVSDNIIKGAFEVLGRAQEKLPKQMVEATAGDKKDKNEYGIVKMKRGGSIRMHVKAEEALQDDTTADRIEKEISEPKFKPSDQLRGKQKVDDIEFDGSERQKFPGMLETEDFKENAAEIEQLVKNVNREKFEKIPVEANGGFRKDMKMQTTREDRENPKRRVEASNAAKEEFPMKIVDSVPNRRDRLKDTKIKEAKEVKEELVKQKSEKKMEETEDVKDEGAKAEQFVNKVKGKKYGKIQVEANGGLMEDITKESTQTDREEPKIHATEKDQQCLREDMGKERFETSTIAREFPMQMVDAQAKKREGSNDREIEEAERVDEEVAKRNTDETKVVGSTTREKLQELGNERNTQTFQEVPEGKHPKPLETGIPERELQSAKGTTTWEKVVSMEFKEIEQGIAKNKTLKMVLLPPENQRNEAHESENDNVKQVILKPKKPKVGEGEQSNDNRESTKAVATIEDQVAKSLSEPRFPIAQQSEAEQKGKLYEGFKAKDKVSLESRKEDPIYDLQNSIKMKDSQESNQTETLKQEDPSEEHQKKRQQVSRRDEFYEGQKVKKTMQEKSEEPKNIIDDRDQQNVQWGISKGIEIAETKVKEMSTEKCVADVGQIAKRIHTKRDFEARLERDKFTTTQNVNDEKPLVKEEIRKAEPPEAVSSLPKVTSMWVGPKNENEEQPWKELSPKTEEMKSKGPIELEKHIMEWKFPKIKEHVPESAEDDEAPKVAAYQGPKPSNFQSPTLTKQAIDKENQKLENVVEAHEASKESSPKENTEIDFKECNERTATVESEELKTLQPHIPESHCLEEKQKADGKEEAADECKFHGIYEDDTKPPAILIVGENNEKGYQMTKNVEDELMKGEHKAEIVLEKRVGPKVTKSGETKEASKQLLQRESAKITPTTEDKKPQMEDKFEQFVEKMHETCRESEKMITKSGIVITPNKRVEESPLPLKIKRKEPHELSWPRMEHEIAPTEGTTEPHVVTDKVTKPSKISSSSSTQPFEDKEKDSIDASHDQIETLQPDSTPTNQQCKNKDSEECDGIPETEDKKSNEHDIELLKKQKEEASEGKKDGTKGSKKLLVPLLMAGSALLVSCIVIFVRNRRARKW
ncbi:hypothetical protein TanjilG_23303 [Lupinus angustifolius]|uniref:SHSP domain-containing protein n=1 Tax=Lupinus angustifolius TaxID=3871 RepID=A0A1J7H0I1_LUPAN|nr:PREDICTED: trichohyalin isoform X2 [Lupinus angustifolius]OIW06246.1 hypothetical protein TanjilG_23303 [Lupinus angustifolius]